MCYGQQYDLHQFTMRDGLPSDYVYGVLEDNRGYIWAYTENGLAKYDGYTWQSFSVNDGLPGNDVVHALKDSAGVIWLWTYQNRPAYLSGDSIVALDAPVAKMGQKIDGSVYYSSGDQITFWVEKGGIQHLPKHNFISKDCDRCRGVQGREGFFAYNYTTGEVSFLRQRRSRRFTARLLEKATISREYVFQLTSQTDYLIQNGGPGLLLVNTLSEKSTSIDLRKQLGTFSHIITTTILDSSFIVTTDGGAVEYDVRGNAVEVWKWGEWAENYSMKRTFKDSQGNLWQGTREGGVFMISKSKRQSQLISPYEDKDRVFRQFVVRQGELLGITQMRGVYQIQEDKLECILPPIKDVNFRSALQVDKGIIISSGWDCTLLDEQNQAFQIKDVYSYQFEKGMTPEEKILRKKFRNEWALAYEEHSSTIYGSTYSGIERREYDRPDHIFYSRYPGTMSTLYYHADERQMFGGNADGVFLIEKSQFRPYPSEHLQLANVSTLYGDGKQLWIGTENNGLYLLALDSDSLSLILNADHIRNIRPGAAEEELLIASNMGVWVITKDGDILEHYDTREGLFVSDVQDVACMDSRYIYAATTRGLHLIDRDVDAGHQPQGEPGDLQLIEVLVNQQPIDLSMLEDLSHDANNLEFRVSLLSMASLGDISYHTLLEPLNTTWRETKERTINFQSLSPGKYTLWIQAEDLYENQFELPPISFTIKAPLWDRPWFKILLVAVVIGATAFFFERNIRLRKQELEQERVLNRQIAELELTAIRAQMNPHFVFNALGAIQYYIQTEEIALADNYLTRFATLMRKYLESSIEKFITLEEEIELLSIYTELEQLRFGDMFSVRIEVSPPLNLEEIYLPGMLIQPFVENAINHGLTERGDRLGELEIQFYEQGEYLVCEVKDNGIGKENAARRRRSGHKSRGMELTHEKIQTWNTSGFADVKLEIKCLYDDQSAFPGTHVILRINNFEHEPS